MSVADSEEGGAAGMSPINLVGCSLEDLVAALLNEQPIAMREGGPPFVLESNNACRIFAYYARRHDRCKKLRHLPIKAQRDHLAKVIRCHCAYYGLTGNGKRLGWFRYQVVRIWRKWLARRSRLRCLNWDRMADILKRHPLPPVTFTRSWQSSRANLSGVEPSASIAPARVCEGRGAAMPPPTRR